MRQKSSFIFPEALTIGALRNEQEVTGTAFSSLSRSSGGGFIDLNTPSKQISLRDIVVDIIKAKIEDIVDTPSTNSTTNATTNSPTASPTYGPVGSCKSICTLTFTS